MPVEVILSLGIVATMLVIAMAFLSDNPLLVAIRRVLLVVWFVLIVVLLVTLVSKGVSL